MLTKTASPRWVEVLFTRLQVRYGDAWTRKWDGIDTEAIKGDWCDQLGTLFERNPKAIAHGLQHLPDYPPNADGFLRICLLAPSPDKALPAPVSKPDKEFALDVHAKVQEAAKKQEGSPAQVLVAKMREKMSSGQRLTSQQAHVLASCEKMLGINREVAA